MNDTDFPDATRLIVEDQDGQWVVLYRDDRNADRTDQYKRWFVMGDDEPRTLAGQLVHAKTVYALGERLAVLA